MFKAQSQIAGVKTLANRVLRITVDCEEMPAEQEAELFKLRNEYGWFGFEKADILTMELPKEPLEFNSQKSLSERLRNVIFVYHQSKGGKPEDFEIFRAKQMEKIIQQYKDLLN